MLGNLFKRLRGWLAVKALEKNPVYGMVFTTIRDTLTDPSKGLGKYADQEFKQELTEQILKEVAEVVSTQNPVMANRKKLADYVLKMAKYQVLILPAPNEPEEEVSGLRGKPGITGEIKAHLKEIAEKDEEIKELAWSLDTPTVQDIYEACVVRYWVAVFKAAVFHSIRLALGDYHPTPEKDWYRPFVAAMCAWEEYNYREKIGLPDISPIAALKYLSFFHVVMSGAKYPNFEWEEHYKRKRA